MARRPREPDWRGLLAGWDRQQEEFNATREQRFTVMFEVLAGAVGQRFTALDLGCGPGSLSQRLLRRFPRARSVAVDYDPVVLRIGQGALGNLGGRLTWADAKMASRGWTRRLPQSRFDAALSTTALHWLEPEELRALYRDLHRLLRRGGVFLNGDILPWDRSEERFRQIARKVHKARMPFADGQPAFRGWERWWARAEKEAFLGPFFEERKARESRHPHHEPASLDLHVDALRRAGFRDIEVVWQDVENRVLAAIR